MELDQKRDYVAITFVKDEEKNLPELIKTVAEQSIQPNLWLFVNDGSIDVHRRSSKTPEKSSNG